MLPDGFAIFLVVNFPVCFGCVLFGFIFVFLEGFLVGFGVIGILVSICILASIGLTAVLELTGSGRFLLSGY